MQNYPVNYPMYQQNQTGYRMPQQPAVSMQQQSPAQYSQPQTAVQTTQTTAYPAAPAPSSASGATFNIGVPQSGDPNATNINGASGVTINILGAGVYPNGANINNSYYAPQTPAQTNPIQAYPANYYMSPMCQPMQPSVPIASTSLNQNTKQAGNEKQAMKDIVLLTDEYIQTLENYLRNDNVEIKIMGAKELLKRFKEDESRKNDPALTALLNLTLQSKYSQVKLIGMNIIENGWAQGDQFTQQLLRQIQESKSGYGLDALDAASAALKSAGKTVKVVDPNPPKPKENKK